MVSSKTLTQAPALEQNAERLRLAEAHKNMKPWYRWGPYLSERQWGTVREDYYYFLDNTPTHSYMKALYKYPQRAFPYADLVAENRRRGRGEPEYELIDTGVFADDRYFDITVEYAKVDPQDILIRITAANRGPDAAPLHVLPTLWFRNTWAWGYDHDDADCRPELRAVEAASISDGTQAQCLIRAMHATLGEYWLACEDKPQLLFTENESNAQQLWGVPNHTPFVKDGINDAVVNGVQGAVNPDDVGTKAAAHYTFVVAAGATETVMLRLSATQHDAPFADAEEVFEARQAEHPYVYRANGMEYVVRYEPGESSTGLFGGNSNWRGLIWFPINFLLIETLQKFHHYYGDDFLVECPTGSGNKLTLWQIADRLSCRLTHIFLRGEDGRRPVFGTNEIFQTNPHWRDYPLFYEYFHGDTGRGVSASHQTGWTAVVAKLLEQTEGR